MYVCIYVYIYVYICVYVYMYVYIDRSPYYFFLSPPSLFHLSLAWLPALPALFHIPLAGVCDINRGRPFRNATDRNRGVVGSPPLTPIPFT